MLERLNSLEWTVQGGGDVAVGEGGCCGKDGLWGTGWRGGD